MGEVLQFHISIPVWYDWESTHAQLAGIFGSEFQFQYGTIERLTFKIIFEILIISIPVWYDWEIKAISHEVAFLLFQFQYGTIESL